MRKIERRKITRWSYSAWSSFKSCPFKFFRTRIMGDKEPSNRALERGNMVHAKAEGLLKGRITGMPNELAKLARYYKQLRQLKPVVETYWNVDRNWKPVHSKDDTWCTMKMDAAVEPCRATDRRLFIQDLKTGREYNGHKDQASLYACIGAVKYPKSVGVEVEFWYSDHGYSQPYFFTPSRIKHDTDIWIERGEQLMSEKRFLPTPSIDACKYCFLRTDRGGMCDAWKANK